MNSANRFISFLFIGLFILLGPASAQLNTEFIKNGGIAVTFVENAVYSETTTAVKLNENRTIVGGFYRGADGKRKSCILLIGNDGRLIENGYKTGFLAYNLYEDNDNFVGDIVKENNGGAYILGTTAQGSIYTGYLAKVSNEAMLDDNFSIPNTEDTGFIRIHNNKMVFPGTEDHFQELDDTTYTEPKKLLMQSDGKLLVVGVTRKQMNEVNYEDGESFVMRLFPDGRIDPSFGQEGVAHINLTDLCEDVETAILDNKGRIILFGNFEHPYNTGPVSTQSKNFVLRLTKEGAIDKSFGSKGEFVFQEINTTFRPVAILPDSESSILLFSNSKKEKEDETYSYGLTVFKLLENGTIDKQFHNKGSLLITKMGVGFSNDVVRTEDGKILICGTNQNLVKEHTSGTDLLFSSNIQPRSDKEYTEEELNSESEIGFNLRLNSDCSLDKTFPKNGLFFTSWADHTQKLYLSRLVSISKNEILNFGAGESEEMGDTIGFVTQRIIFDLKLGEIACKKDLGMSFYPNPIKDQFSIEFDLCEVEKISISLFNINGQLVKEFLNQKEFLKGHHKESFQLNTQIASGVYILSLRGKDFSKSVKVIVE